MAEDDSKVAEIAEKTLSGLKEDDIRKMLSDGSAMSGLSQKLAAHINQAMGGGGALLAPRDKPQMRRIRALKRLQLESTELEAQFYTEVQKLEAKYLALNQPLFEKRRDIISGSHEPTDEEAHWSEDEDDEEEDATDEKKTDEKADGASGETEGKANGAGASGGASKDSPSTGVEDFWLIALKNCDIFADLIKEEDEPVLQHLVDIKVLYADDTGMDFAIEFHFSDNEWFSTKVLTKSYKVACEVNKEDPWSFEGAAITDGKGCTIDWKKGKNLTVKTVKRKPKKKGAPAKTKVVPCETFFNMFSPPSLSGKDDMAEDEEEIAQTLSDDYTRAEFIRDRLVPKAVLFFTGEALDEDGGDEDFEEDFDEDDEDLEDDYNPAKQVAATKQECKNQ